MRSDLEENIEERPMCTVALNDSVLLGIDGDELCEVVLCPLEHQILVDVSLMDACSLLLEDFDYVHTTR